MREIAEAIRKVSPVIEESNTRSLQLEYAKCLKLTFETIMDEGVPYANDFTHYRRYDFFERNIELLEVGRPPTRGLKDMIDSRINWLLDLLLVDYELLCDTGGVFALDIWNLLDIAKWDSTESEEFLKKYATYLLGQRLLPEVASSPVGEMNVKEMIDFVVKEFRKKYRDLVLVEAILLMTWSS